MIARRTLLHGMAIGLAAPSVGACSQESGTFRIGSHVSAMSTGINGVLAPWIEAVQTENTSFNYHSFWGGTLGKDAFKQYDMVVKY